jgi:type I restriction enzyme S subunit
MSLPTAWPTERAKWLLERQSRPPRADDGVVTAFRDGQVTLRANRRMDGFTEAVQEIGYQGIRKGDLVVHSMDGFAGAIGISDSDGKASPVVHAYTVTAGADARFIAYFLRAMAKSGYIESLAKGIRERSTSFDAATLANLQLPCPPLDEQRRIANFLDAETARIDLLAALQSSVRATVQARDKAQLDLRFDELTNAYSSMPFRRLIWSIEQGISPQCDNFPAGPEDWGVLKVSAVKNGTFFEEENKQLPADIEPEARYEVKQGDLLITRANTPQLVGAAAVAESPRQKLMLCDKIFRVTTTRGLMPEFLVLASLSTKIRDMCAEASHGTSQSMANLKTEEIKSWPIPKAPINAQCAVVAELSAAREHTKSLTDAIDRQLATLAERRQALITAAATGGITV